ncbi:MAG: cation:proton antiporter [Chloroflexota bacterium]
MPDLLTAFALIAVVLTVSALASPLVERAPLSFPMIFLGLGVLLGERGAGLIAIDAHDQTLEAIAIFNLSLVLFLDAVKLRFDEGARAWLIPALVLGPGTLLTIGLVAGAAALLLDTPLVPSLLLGAILASTDPVVLRDVVRDRRIPRPVRDALSIEAGTNDVVVLPSVLVLIAVAQAQAGGAREWLAFLAKLFLVGPAVGFAVGGSGSWLIGQIDARLSIRREYQALFGVGLVLAAYAAGQAVGGDGFLAAFAAGVAVVVLNRELCDCFFEYGEVTAEMAMLLAFVLFGAVLSTLVDLVPLGLTLLFAVLVIAVARPLALGLVLARVSLSRQARAFMAWFGPRGLNSLLLALLVVLSDAPDAERLLAIVGVVVIASVVAHGASATPVAAWYGRSVARETLPEERESTAAGLFEGAGGDVPRNTPEELAQRLEGPDPPIVLDVRTRSQYESDRTQIPGSIRVLPDQIDQWAAIQPAPRSVVAYCT